MKLLQSLFLRVVVAFLLASFATSMVLLVAERALRPPSDEGRFGDIRAQQEEAFARVAVALAEAEGVESVNRALNDDDDLVVLTLLGEPFASFDAMRARDERTRQLLERAVKPPYFAFSFERDRFNVAQTTHVGDRAVTLLIDDYAPDPPNPMHNSYVRNAIVVIISGLVCLALAMSVTRPMKRLSRVVEQYGQGKLDARYGAVRWRDEVGELGIRFDEMANRIQELIDSQRRLLRDVSHELRSPLTRLQLALGIARNQPEQYQASLDRVELETNRLNGMIGELLTLARLEAPSVEAWEDVDVGQLLATIVDDARFEAESRDAVVQLTCVDGGYVHANVNLLYRALDNLVRNAVKYAPPGTEVEIRQELLPSDNGTNPARCQVTVRDQGPGIPEAELSAVLQPFVRSSNATENGVGLGLAIADRIIRQLRGTLTLRNAPSGGLLATVVLPVRA